jgi:hypothetical protein
MRPSSENLALHRYAVIDRIQTSCYAVAKNGAKCGWLIAIICGSAG